MLDTGATFCFASESFARRHKLRLLPDPLSCTAATGKIVPARVGLADTVQLGKLTLHNVVFGVVRDKDVILSAEGFVIDAVIGLPVLIATGHFRVAPDGGSVTVGFPSEEVPPEQAPAKNLALDGLIPLVAVRYQGSTVPFGLDTGSYQTDLFEQFTKRFPQILAGSTSKYSWRYGLGGGSENATQSIPRIELGVGNVLVVLGDAEAHTGDPLAGPPTLGVMGANFLRGGYEIDFRRMLLSVNEH